MKVNVKGEWFFEYSDGTIKGPLNNFITQAGFGLIAQNIGLLPSPYLVIGDDTAPGETIAELLRKPVSSVSQSGNQVRFRTQLLPGEANGDHRKVSIFVGATDVAGTGTMLNLLVQPWSKSANTVLTVEARITVKGE
ncbi:hypothetical protein GTO91_02980 [Heliobacterium undosum]|uniref:Uncharacterized protein n=1 Tax=Heliomicrobium undosum TaxID=121734 RepID=A0A845KYP6_9FIRM|nr:hypothetical protein [Heliomicrobium undosum]MZP28683.1 hypothetical protein [Heliomicrobium undosum]